MGVGQCAGQTVTVLADRDFSLGPKEIGPVGSGALLAQPDRLEFVGIGRRAARIVVADPDGVVQSTSPDIVNVHQQIYKAMPRPDGSVWVVASGPHAFAAGYGAVDVPGIAALTTQRALSASGSRGDASFIQMDLYTPDGKRVDSARVGGPFETVPRPIGVWDDGIVFRSLSRALLMSVSHGQTKEVASAAMPEVRRTLSLTTPDGKVIVIERESGRYVVADSPVMQISGL
jgi:hypothetical protein